MRRILLLAAFLLSAAARASTVTFVSPLDGSQAIGPMLLEISTDASDVDRVEFLVDGVLAGVARTPPYRIYFDFGTSLSARTVSAKVWSGGYATAQTAAIRTAGLTANEKLDVDVVEVPVRVRSRQPLKASGIRVRENGVDQIVRDVKVERPPAHFAFVVDRSLSMGDGKLDAALGAIQQELDQLRSGDSASIVLFNHNVAPLEPVARDADLRSRYGATVPSGGTSLRDALASVSSGDRTYAIVITDGGDRNSVLSDEAALRKISGTRTVVYALVMGESHARFLDRAAANTGGGVFPATRTSVRAGLSRVLTDINSRYLVVYQSHGTKRGWRTIDVTSKRRDVVILNARKGYFAEP